MAAIDIDGQRYKLKEQVGKSMQAVYRARAPSGQTVYVKLAKGPNGSAVEAMTREAYALRRLDHPNIVRLLASSWRRDPHGGIGGVPALVTESRGRPLLDWCYRRARVHPSFAQDIVSQISSALDYQHEQGIVHRDIKPQNITVQDQRASVIDYGVCWSPDISFLDDKGTAYGTLLYMSRCQLAADTPTPRDDQYSLSLTAYELLTGQRARMAMTRDEAIAMMEDLLQPASTSNPRVSSAASDVLTRAAHPDPAERYESCGQFAAELKSALTRTSRRAA